tara:strand:+ start:5404 stop:5676 length:273 start_codon:yes stop_codon:yes gene_type:complete
MEIAIRYADFGSMEEIKFLMDNYSDEKALQERLDMHNQVSDNGTAIRYKGQKKDIWNLTDRIDFIKNFDANFSDINKKADERFASLFAKS